MCFIPPFVDTTVLALAFSDSGIARIGEANGLLDKSHLETLFSSEDADLRRYKFVPLEGFSNEDALETYIPDSEPEEEGEDEEENAGSSEHNVLLYPLEADEPTGSEPYFACPLSHADQTVIYRRPRSEIIAGSDEPFDPRLWDKMEITDEVIPGLMVERGCSIDELT